jgi:hypothetical protein
MRRKVFPIADLRAIPGVDGRELKKGVFWLISVYLLIVRVH